MLVLSRGVDEAIMIGDQIVVRVVAIKGDKVRLGVQAPAGVAVHRQEVYEAIQRENLRAAGTGQEAIERLRTLIPSTGARREPPPAIQVGGDVKP